MAVTPKRARELALALENSSSAPHFDRVAFRTPRRIFATLALNGSDMNFMFDHELQRQFCALAPEAIAPVAGGWGRLGATRCDLQRVAGKRAPSKGAQALLSRPRAALLRNRARLTGLA